MGRRDDDGVSKATGRRTETIYLTKDVVEKLPTPTLKRSLVYDSEERGLGVKVEPTGLKQFFWFRRVGAEKKHKWVTLGEADSLSVEKARDAAKKLNVEKSDWKAGGFTGKAPRLKKGSDATLGEANKLYCEEHLRNHAKKADLRIKETTALFFNHLEDWKDRKLTAITTKDIRDRHAAVKAKTRAILQKAKREIHDKTGNYAANYVYEHLRALYGWCIRRGMFDGENPAQLAKEEKFPQEERTRFLNADEVKRLYASLEDEPNIDARDFVLLALHTGQRKGDVMAMCWNGTGQEKAGKRSRISLKDCTWTIPDPKNNEVHTTVLNGEAIEILERRAKSRGDSPWVFPSATSKTGHVVDFKAQWQRIRSRAKLDDVRFHDLCHTFASWLALRNTSTLVIQKAIGHRSAASTVRYSHLSLDPIRATVLAMGAEMRLAGGAKPVPAPARKRLSAGKKS